MKNIWKYILGIGAAIIGILALTSKGSSKKQFKKDIKDNKKKVKDIQEKTKKLEKEKNTI